MAETIWQNLASVFQGKAVESVHLCDFPAGNPANVDDSLSARMKLLREIASLGRSVRNDNKLKVRQPLSKVEVILTDPSFQAWLEEHDALLRDELNVKAVEYARDATKYITYTILPNLKRLGPRIGKSLPAVKAALAKVDGGKILAELSSAGKFLLTFDGGSLDLDGEDIQVRLQAKPGWAAAQGSGCVVVLSTEITPELLAEGLVKDLVRLIQDQRKELQLDFVDRIRIGISSSNEVLLSAVLQHQEYLCGETLAESLVIKPLGELSGNVHEVGDSLVTLFVEKA